MIRIFLLAFCIGSLACHADHWFYEEEPTEDTLRGIQAETDLMELLQTKFHVGKNVDLSRGHFFPLLTDAQYAEKLLQVISVMNKIRSPKNLSGRKFSFLFDDSQISSSSVNADGAHLLLNVNSSPGIWAASLSADPQKEPQYQKALEEHRERWKTGGSFEKLFGRAFGPAKAVLPLVIKNTLPSKLSEQEVEKALSSFNAKTYTLSETKEYPNPIAHRFVMKESQRWYHFGAPAPEHWEFDIHKQPSGATVYIKEYVPALKEWVELAWFNVSSDGVVEWAKTLHLTGDKKGLLHLYRLTEKGSSTQEHHDNVPIKPLSEIYPNDLPKAKANPEYIAILDVGLNYNHPGIAHCIPRRKDNSLVGYDFQDMDGLPYDAGASDFITGEVQHHGTGVAGLAAKGPDQIGIIPLRFPMDSQKQQGLYDAVKFAHTHGARTINLSFHVGVIEEESKKFLKKAIHDFPDMLFVVAAGNYGEDGDVTPLFPANYQAPNLISVASVNEWGRLSSFSNYGEKTVHIAARGGDVTVLDEKGGETCVSGTSFASPIVANIAAKIRIANPRLTPFQIKTILMETVQKTPTLAGKIVSEGIVDEAAAIMAAKTARTLQTKRHRMLHSGVLMHDN